VRISKQIFKNYERSYEQTAAKQLRIIVTVFIDTDFKILTIK